MNGEASIEIQTLMRRFRSGDASAAGQLVEHLYPELRRLAAARMRREGEHTWTPTALVNELYLELVKVKALRDAHEDVNERQAFLGLAGFIMRRLLIHHSRPLYRKAEKLELESIESGLSTADHLGPESLAEIDNLLGGLAKLDPKLRAVVELRVFEGKTVDEAAKVIGCSPRAVHKYWRFATHWLGRELDSVRL